MRSRWPFVPILLLVLILPAGVAEAQNAASTVHVDPNSEIPFSLERGRATTPLPFDVPFFLVSEVPGTSKSIKAEKGQPDANGDCVGRTGLRPTRIFPKTENNQRKLFAEIPVPKLEVDQNHCFAFDLTRERTEEESKKIIAALRQPLAQLYRRATPQTMATEAGSAAFRDELLRVVQRAVAPAVVEIEPNSFLDPRNPFSPIEVRKVFEAPVAILEDTRDIVQNYINRRLDRRTKPQRVPTITSNATSDEIAAELQIIESEITNAGAESTIGRDLRFISEDLLEAQNRLTQFEQSIDRIAAEIDQWLVDHYDVVATTTASYEGRFHWYVSADLGVGVAPELDDFFDYVGMNIYFRPVNKKAPVSSGDWKRRLAVTVGLAEALTGNDRAGVIRDRPLLLGVGWRISEHIRLSIGGQVIQEDDPDPLVNRKTLAVTPYFGASVDFDIANTIRGFFAPRAAN